MTFLRSLARYHSDALQGRLHDVCLTLTQEVAWLLTYRFQIISDHRSSPRYLLHCWLLYWYLIWSESWVSAAYSSLWYLMLEWLCLSQFINNGHLVQVKNLRSGVSRFAVCTLGDLFTHLHKAMDQELEGTVKALLQKSAETNAFIRQDVNGSLDCMVQHCTPTRSISALLSGGLRSVSTLITDFCFGIFLWLFLHYS